MDYFFGQADGDSMLLSNEEFNHLKNVKRIKAGDLFMTTDGKGGLFTSRYTGSVSVPEIVSKEIFLPKKYSLHIAVAPTKNIDRIEWFIEKAVETGIDEISFIQCRHSERKEIKSDRLMRVAIAAMKQSKKVFLPLINEIIPFNTFITKYKTDSKLLFTQTASTDSSFSKNYRASQSLVALIGPEGDFHESEIKLAVENGFIPTTLGDTRLRTETAALSVCTIFNFMNSQ
jgi:16S rRNA (uracil1498-N3)-methyltransferase